MPDLKSLGSMLTKQEKRAFRGDLFRHLDGIGTAPTCMALHRKGVLLYLLEQDRVSVSELSQKFNANEGYLNVALRILCSQGWLLRHDSPETDDVLYETVPASEIAFPLFHVYDEVDKLLKFSERFHSRKFEKEPFEMLMKIFESYKNRYGLPEAKTELEENIQNQILKHIEGIMVGPTVVHLGMSGMFHKYFMEASFRPEEFHSDADSFNRLLYMFVHLGWFFHKNGTYQFTDKGLFYAKRAASYGVTVSYIPTFRKLDELIFGNPTLLREDGLKEEQHVDRAMNVWGSGGAHSVYFKVIDEIIIELFNRPISEQPKGILDMGCGNGAFLQHIFEVIANQTERGKLLDEHPLFLVGADYNQAALRITRANLIQADIWAKVIWGDIGRPDLLAKDLEENYSIDLGELLNVRTFLDHNRVWNAPKTPQADRKSTSTGAFATKGQRIDNGLVEDSLKEHLEKWKPYVERFGLLVIELHTISPSITAQNLGTTAATAYDATHGYSDQYIVEVEVFKSVAEESGLHCDPRFSRKFPDSELATVSINLLTGK